MVNCPGPPSPSSLDGFQQPHNPKMDSPAEPCSEVFPTNEAKFWLNCEIFLTKCTWFYANVIITSSLCLRGVALSQPTCWYMLPCNMYGFSRSFTRLKFCKNSYEVSTLDFLWSLSFSQLVCQVLTLPSSEVGFCNELKPAFPLTAVRAERVSVLPQLPLL